MKIRFARIPAEQIFNVMSPANKSGLADTESNQQKRREFERRKFNKRAAWYEEFNQSIEQEGVRNPIIVSAGYCRPDKFHLLPCHLQKNPERILTNDIGGGNRLYYAQKYGLTIPCVVNDHVDMFPEAKELKTTAQILRCFTDRPVKWGVKFGEDIKGFFARY